VKIITPSKQHVKINKDRLKLKKNNFFNKMIAEADNLSQNSERKPADDSGDDDSIEIVDIQSTSGYTFNPLTIQQRKSICERTEIQYREDDLNLSNFGELMGTRPPKVKTIKGDGNCFFRAISVGLTGWEVSHIKIRQLVCDHIQTYGTYTRQTEGKYYVNHNKMKKSGIYATDVEIMAAAQIFGVDIYVYHTYGGTLKWLRFPCRHATGSASSNAIYLDNRYGDGKTGHFDFVVGLF